MSYGREREKARSEGREMEIERGWIERRERCQREGEGDGEREVRGMY